jgi:hypothetical protein
MDWKRLKLSKSEELRIRKEHLLTQFIGILRNTEAVDTLEVLEDDVKAAGSHTAHLGEGPSEEKPR